MTASSHPTKWGRLDFTDVRELRGPLLVLGGVRDVGWDEAAVVRVDGDDVRHGVVLEVDHDLAVVQVMEGTERLRQNGTAVSFAGQPLRIPVGTGWLGRVCNGRGDPLDGGPPVLGEQTAAVAGNPLNPVLREPPAEPVITGVSAIDALTTLVRGQKLPVFSVAGLPHLELAAQIAAQANAGGEPFSVVFAAMGLTHPDAATVRDILEDRAAAGELALFLNTADDPVIERTLTPRIALTVAEHLAYVEGRHVLVVMGDMTSYAEALREVSAARGEIPGRRAYPGYLYSDLASLYEQRVVQDPGLVGHVEDGCDAVVDEGVPELVEVRMGEGPTVNRGGGDHGQAHAGPVEILQLPAQPVGVPKGQVGHGMQPSGPLLDHRRAPPVPGRHVRREGAE